MPVVVCGGIAAEKPVDRLGFFGSRAFGPVTVDVDEGAEQIGYFTVRFSAQVPPEDQPTTPQFAGSSLTREVVDREGTTSSVRWSAALPRTPLTHSVSL